MQTMLLQAPCLFGLERYVKEEIYDLGYDIHEVIDGRVTFEGDAEAVARTNLNLRCAERVMILLARFPARSFEQLYQGVRGIDWPALAARQDAVVVTGSCVKSLLHSVPACQKIVKKAVVDSLCAAYRLVRLPETGVRLPVQFFLLRDEAMILLDTSGAPLHKRGYRAQGVAAPLKETLAAAMVKLSHYNGRDPFCDPFCGSGTIAIEAALIARNRAPGLNRSFAAQHWAMVDKRIWLDAADEAMDALYEEGGEALARLDAGRGPEKVRALALRLYAFLGERPDPEAWLSSALDRAQAPVAAWMEELARAARRALEAALAATRAAHGAGRAGEKWSASCGKRRSTSRRQRGQAWMNQGSRPSSRRASSSAASASMGRRASGKIRSGRPSLMKLANTSTMGAAKLRYVARLARMSYCLSDS